MRCRRLTDRLMIYNWTIALIVIGLGLFNITTHVFVPIEVILAQLALVSIQFLTIITGCKAFDKRSNFSDTVSITVHRSIMNDQHPTREAIDNFKQELREKYAKEFRIL